MNITLPRIKSQKKWKNDWFMGDPIADGIEKNMKSTQHWILPING